MQTVDNTALSQLASEVSARIAALESLFEESLDSEMDALKEVLVQNPSAAALLKDEDVGLLVLNLRRTVSADIQAAVAGKTKTSKAKSAGSKKLSVEEIQAALEAEGF